MRPSSVLWKACCCCLRRVPSAAASTCWHAPQRPNLEGSIPGGHLWRAPAFRRVPRAFPGRLQHAKTFKLYRFSVFRRAIPGKKGGEGGSRNPHYAKHGKQSLTDPTVLIMIVPEYVTTMIAF